MVDLTPSIIPLIMNKTTTLLEKDIEYCIDYLELNDTQIGNLLRACEELGNISCEHFCEEFVVTDDNEDPIFDPDYLNINEVNRLYYNNIAEG